MTNASETLTIDAVAALDAVKRVRAIIDRRNTVPLLAAVLIEASETGVVFKSTDCDAEIAVDVGALSGAGSFRVATNAEGLAKILAGSKRGEEIELAASGGGDVLLQAGGVDFTLPGVDPAGWPTIEFEPASYVALPGTFGETLAFVSRGMSTEATRFYLNGACLYDDGVECGLVATDGCRMFGERLPSIEPGTLALPGSGYGAQAIIPRGVVPSIVSALAGDVSGVLESAANRPAVRIKCGPVTITTKLVDGTFPDWRRVRPRTDANAFGFEATREAIEVPMKRAMKVGSNRFQAIRVTVNGSVRVDVNGHECGKASAEIDAADKWGESCIGFDGVKVLAFMPDKGEAIRIQCSEATQPALMQYPAHPDRFGVLMPVRV
jgi:DNA polymerase-3 subunit beta